ncbi:pancreatic triacylglycerol lipase-like [Pararge aegeria]|uniref:pancreatic triacylglycerol lipase-like n=1 Tax=Pararge aegeria TaxID=116150 RepID=UPI0019D146A6|nr:pancreatic triacylglycerol lipase-like [Pararge aegeria]
MCAITKIALVMCVAATAHSFNLGPTQIVFHLFTRQNPTQSQPLLPSQASLLASGFQYDRPTVLTIHSHGPGVAGNFNAHVVSAYLAVQDINVLAVDWSPGSSTYTTGLASIPQVGRVVAQFVNLLSNDFGYNTANIHIVGVGLGGHAAGIAARMINGNVPRIIALDPSLPGWTHHPDKLTKNDADLVEVIHTTAGLYGYDYPLGDIDFYPNGGAWQVGCVDVSCSHTYAFVFYAESLRADIPNANAPRFVGTACESYEEAIELICTGARDVVFGGTAAKTGVSGIYTFETNITPPFARN